MKVPNMFFGTQDLPYLKAGILWAKRGERGILRKMECLPPLANKAALMQASILKQNGGKIRDWKHA